MELLRDPHRAYRRLRPNPAEKIQLANAGLQWVLSSNVSGIGVNDNDLIIRFHNGSIYEYPNQAKLFEPMMNSNSKGGFVWARLRRPRVAYRKIGALPFKDDDQVTDDEVFALVDREGLALLARLTQMGLYVPNGNTPLDLIGLSELI